MLSGHILPLISYSKLRPIIREDGIVFNDQDFVYLLKFEQEMPSISVLSSMNGYEGVHLDEEGSLWFENFDEGKSVLFDATGDVFRDVPYLQSTSVLAGDIRYIKKNGKLGSVSSSGVESISNFERVRDSILAFRGSAVFEGFDGVIRCVDRDFEQRWMLPARKRVSGGLKLSPQIHEASGSILVNYGSKDTEFSILCVDGESGETRWELLVPSVPFMANLIGDEVYISVQDEFWIVDVNTGIVLLNVKIPEKMSCVRWATPYADTVVIGGELRGADGLIALAVFKRQSSQFVQNISIPEKVGGCRGFYEFFTLSNRVFVPLVSPNIDAPYSAIAVLSVSSSVSEGLVLEGLPVIEITTQEEKEGQTEYSVSVSGPSSNLTVAYVAWALKDLALAVGNSTTPDKKRFDRRHNGIIRLGLDHQRINPDWQPYVELLPSIVERYLRNIKPGIGAGSFKIVLEDRGS